MGEAEHLGKDPAQESDEEVAPPVQPRAGDARRAQPARAAPAQPDSEDDAEAVDAAAAAPASFDVVTEVRRGTSFLSSTHPPSDLAVRIIRYGIRLSRRFPKTTLLSTKFTS